MISTGNIHLSTKGHADLHDVTEDVANLVRQSGMKAGIVTIFTPSSTSALTTIEFEPGCVADLQSLLDQIIPPSATYQHNQRWGDGNGHSHTRAALLGPSLTIPFEDGRPTLGTWQQIIFCDFDNRPRQRNLVVQIMGE